MITERKKKNALTATTSAVVLSVSDENENDLFKWRNQQVFFGVIPRTE